MGGIRVTYTGLISFGTKISSILTGLVFTLIVTRQLTAEEFGTWGLINGIIVYAVILHPIVSYWTTREIARGEDTGRTSVVTTGGLSLIGMCVYITIAYVTGIQSNADLKILMLATILIPVIFVNESLNGVLLGFKPHARSFGFISFEIAKIPVALVLVYYLQLGLEGAILASFVAYLVSIVILLKYAKEKLSGNFVKSHIKKWFKLSWLPLYRKIPGLISMSDVVVFSIITGSIVGIAYYTAARTIGFLVYHSRSITSGVYPKLLEGGHEKVLSDNLVQFFYVSIPIVAISITFARPGLFALNPIYEIAAPVVILLSVRQFLTSLNMILFNALQGIEKVDLKKDASFKDYSKSNLVLFPTFQMIRHAVYIGSLVVILAIVGTHEEDEINLVIYWAIVGLIVEIPLSMYIIKLVKKSFSLKIDYKSISKYLFSTILVFSILYLVMDEYLVYYESIFYFLPHLALFMVVGIGSYIGITYVIDTKTKMLINGIIKEITTKNRNNDGRR
jgi:hypothetical protein